MRIPSTLSEMFLNSCNQLTRSKKANLPFCYRHLTLLSKCTSVHRFSFLKDLLLSRNFHCSAQSTSINNRHLKKEKDIENVNPIDRIRLKKELQKCKSVTEQIELLHTEVSLTEEDVALRKSICEDISNVFKLYFPDSFVCLFGSSVTGLGRRGCDVDLSFHFSSDQQVEPSSAIYMTHDILGGKVSASVVPSLPPKKQLRFLQKLLQEYGITNSVTLIPGRHPLLSFCYKHLTCDLSIDNRNALHCTQFIRLCQSLDCRVAPLFHVISYNFSHFIGGINKFKSYAIFLLLVFFLQSRQTPILRSVKDIFEKTDFSRNYGNLSYDACRFASQFEKSKNTESLEELLREFFFFYLNFDFSFVIDPMHKLAIDKHTFAAKYNLKDNNHESEKFTLNSISIQDPLSQHWNVTTDVSFKYCRLFMQGFISACHLYQERSLWTPSDTHHWGLGTLLWGKCPYSDLHTNNFLLKIPLDDPTESLEQASKAVFAIFEHCLMFSCRPLNSMEGNRFRCKVVDTWSGRGCWRDGAPAGTSFEEREHWVSMQMLEHRTAVLTKEQFEFDFGCESVIEQGEAFLMVRLTPVSSGGLFIPKMNVILKDYVERGVAKLLSENKRT